MLDAEPTIHLVHAFHRDAVVRFAPAARWTGSWFGGPIGASIASADLQGAAGAPELHSIASLATGHIPGARAARDLPLLYGMRFGGCTLRYAFSAKEVRIASLDPPEPSEGWPYRNYPSLLPYVPLEVGASLHCSWRAFASDFPNLPPAQPSDLVVVVPAPMTLGMSLWGPNEDAEGTTLVFECDLTARTVFAYNRCD